MEYETRKFIEIIEPVVDYIDMKQAASKAAERPNSLDGKSVALLANWKPISLPFLQVMAEELTQTVGLKSFAVHPDWQFTHPERVGKIGPEADRLARQCELMLSGVAD